MVSDIDGLANVLEADLGKHKEQIIRMMLRCVTELPTKTPIYGTLAGLLNVKNMDFGADLGARSSHKSLLACVLCIVCCSHELRTSDLGSSLTAWQWRYWASSFRRRSRRATRLRLR